MFEEVSILLLYKKQFPSLLLLDFFVLYNTDIFGLDILQFPNDIVFCNLPLPSGLFCRNDEHILPLFFFVFI